MKAKTDSQPIQITADSVNIRQPGGVEIRLPNLWLRDNCPCDECRVVETQEKRFILSRVDADIAPIEASLCTGKLSILWPDNHRTEFPLSVIDELMVPATVHYQPWPQHFMPQAYDWSLFLNHSQTTVAALTSFMQQGAVVLSGAPTQPETLELLAPVLGPIRELLFDRIHNVSVAGHVYNIAHTSQGLPPHNDFASYSFPPSVQALHMLQNETPGGESIIVDGWAILEQLRHDHPEYFEILCQFPVPFREFDEHNETYAVEPMVRCDVAGNIQALRFSNQLMQMMNPMQQGIQRFYRAYRELCVRIMHRESAARASFRLEGGQLLLVAAHRVLHARESFQPIAARHLQDAYFELDNIANKLRQLEAAQKPQ
jgi:gamma-butyrobetaine dioxygenase